MDTPQRWFRAEALRSLALPAVVTAIGLQMMRVFFPSLAWYLRDTVGIGSVTLGLYALAAFAVTFAAAGLRRLLGARASLWLAAGGLALVRLIEQVSTQPAADLWLSLVGTALFGVFFPLWLGQLRSVAGPAAAPRLVFGLWLGLALDSGIRGFAGTLDLSWIAGFVPLVATGLLAAAVLWLLLFEPTPEPDAVSDASWAVVLPLIALGPFLLLQALIFQNSGLISEVGGLTPGFAFVVVMAGNVMGVLGGVWGFGRPSTFRSTAALLASAYIVFSAAVAERLGPSLPLTVIVSQLLLGWSWVSLASWVMMRQERGLLRSTVVVGVSLILFLLMAFIYYVSLDLPLPIPRAAIIPFAALLFAGAVLLVAWRRGGAEPHAWMDRTPLVAALALFVLPLAAWFRSPTPSPIYATPSAQIRVMTYNLHSAFNVAGRQDPEAIADVIQASGAQVIGLQEVSRGWLIDGSTDLAAWLSQRLGMGFLFRGTSDAVWGNALMTSYPILDSGYGELPQLDTLIRRGYLWARLDIGPGGPLTVIVTHLHQIESDSDVRQAQVPVVLEAWAESPHTMIMGDLNAEPGSPEMDLFAAAGLRDAWAAAGSGDGLTWRADEPSQRIDWIWLTPDLVILRAEIPRTTASDHLPVWVEVTIAP
ncbi:MAG: endonuclease/exonuclease/phosphatase family protein [Anaerolineales bacterium]